MSSKTKIIVLHLKELLYTGIFLLLAILFIVLLAIMFLPEHKKEARNLYHLHTAWRKLRRR